MSDTPQAELGSAVRLASRAEVAEYLGIPVPTLAAWAHRGRGPAYRLVGRHARYRWSDVEAWLTAQQQGGETS
jgi:excisionase family DNA binding protein